MKNAYLALKQKHQKEINDFPMVFAFGNEQFKEAMKELGLTENDTDKIYPIGVGGFIRKTDLEAFNEMFDRHNKELKESMEGDTTGNGFIFDMFTYELANHEYGYTRELDSTLDALGLTMDDIKASDKLVYSLKKACKEIIERD